MPSRSFAIQVDPVLAEAFNSAPKRKQERVISAMRTLLRIPPPRPDKARRLSKKETGLFLRINCNLTDDKQQRYDQLVERREDAKLTPKEYEELSELVKEVEQIWVDRLRAVAELALLRKVSPEEMMKQLELDPRVEVS